MKSMNEAACEIKSQTLFDEIREMIGFLQTSFQEERAAHQVEEGLWQRVLKLGRYAFGISMAMTIMACLTFGTVITMVLVPVLYALRHLAPDSLAW